MKRYLLHQRHVFQNDSLNLQQLMKSFHDATYLRDLMVYIWILLLCCYQCYPLHLLQLYIQKYPHDIFFMLIFTVFCVVPGFAFKTVTFFLTFLIVTVAFIVSIESKPIFLNFRITEVAVASKFTISRFGSKFVLVFGTSLTS